MGMVMVMLSSTCAFAQFEWSFLMAQQPAAATVPAKSGWSGSDRLASSGVAYSSDYNAVKAAIKTPQQAAAYMEENFSYQQDFRNGSYGAVSPATTNSGKWGDCKDFAVFMGDVLADDGIKVQPITVKYGTSAGTYHVMSVTTYNGAAYLQSNQDLWQVGSNDQILSIASKNLPNGASNLKYWDAGQTDFKP
jgi:hypothetical protein